jgi:hypothetical protein
VLTTIAVNSGTQLTAPAWTTAGGGNTSQMLERNNAATPPIRI